MNLQRSNSCFRHPGGAKRTPGPSGAGGDLFTQAVSSSSAPDRVALARAVGSPGRSCGAPEDDERGIAALQVNLLPSIFSDLTD